MSFGKEITDECANEHELFNYFTQKINVSIELLPSKMITYFILICMILSTVSFGPPVKRKIPCKHLSVF